MKLRPLHEQVAVVMGASSGIGRETAIELAQKGARVVVSARGDEGLDSLVEAILGFGGDALAVPADVTEPDEMRMVAQKAVEKYGRIDTWVHLAAVSLYARFEETTPAEFEQVVRTNLLGQVYGAMAALPHLRDNGRGAFISVSSVEAVRALPYQSAYAAAKHGVNGMLESLRVELKRGREHITITEILPSAMDTPLFEHARTRIGVRPKGMPPIYDPKLTAKAIVHAAEHRTRRLVVGGGGRLLATLEGMIPGVIDTYLALTGFRVQKTRIPKDAQARDNLERPMDSGHSVEGGPITKGRSWSLYTAWTLSRWSRPVTFALALGAGVLVARALTGRAQSAPQRDASREFEYRNPFESEEIPHRSARFDEERSRGAERRGGESRGVSER